ncbi:hypothetical protein ACHMW6_28300 [Pseudoduganella sp. UC29_106]|uniref:hypothetical protein n=1 Tax=Pseudoduganella sp. UC29_106 TaxID=3374553 RepID=UPI00375774D1
MSKRSTTRNPAIAGAIAGILAVALGAWYLKEQRTETATAVVNAKPAAAEAVSREQAVEKLMALPELLAWGAKIEQRSGGKVRGALIEYDPAPRDVEGTAYYQFTFVENGEESVQAWQSFLVSTQRGDILVEDDISGELLTLDRWREDKQPLQRASAQ